MECSGQGSAIFKTVCGARDFSFETSLFSRSVNVCIREV